MAGRVSADREITARHWWTFPKLAWKICRGLESSLPDWTSVLRPPPALELLDTMTMLQRRDELCVVPKLCGV